MAPCPCSRLCPILVESATRRYIQQTLIKDGRFSCCRRGRPVLYMMFAAKTLSEVLEEQKNVHTQVSDVLYCTVVCAMYNLCIPNQHWYH